jgi:hypothetical protein
MRACCAAELALSGPGMVASKFGAGQSTSAVDAVDGSSTGTRVPVHRRRDTLGSDRQRARRVRSTVLRGKSLFSFNRTSGSCWRCKRVCRVKASIPAAIWATPPAPLPPRVRGHPRLQPPAEIRFIGHTAWRKRCDRAFTSWSLY